MRVDFECSGGYVNVHLRYNVEVSELHEENAREIERLVKESGVLEHEPAIQAPSAPVPDVVSYRLTVQDGSRRVSLSCSDVTAPPPLVALLSYLRKLALEARGVGTRS